MDRGFKKFGQIYIILLIVLFLLVYGSTMLSNPLFGDSTIHSKATVDIIKKGVLNSQDPYPYIYNVIQANLYNIAGEVGISLIPLTGIIICSLFLFCLIRRITRRPLMGYLSVFLFLASSKIIFYSSRMYMEVFLSSLFLAATYFFLKYLNSKDIEDLLLVAIFASVSATIKQQGLLILIPSLIMFFLFKYKTKIKLKDSLISFLIMLIILIGPYIALIHSQGYIIPGNADISLVNNTNHFLSDLFGYSPPLDNLSLETIERLNEIENNTYAIGEISGENKHIWPWDPFISLDKFMKIHSLYVAELYFNTDISAQFSYFILALIMFGTINIFIFYYKKNMTLKHFIQFQIIFLLINYPLFMRNTDQMRYHLFIPIFVLLVVVLGLEIIARWNKSKRFMILILTILTVLLLLISLPEIIGHKRWAGSQIYSSSIGGIESVREVGDWFKNNTSEEIKIFQICGNELSYYSNRQVIGDYRFHFLNKEGLIQALKETKIDYIVIFSSQIVTDSSWNNFCKIPSSFENRIASAYNLTYISSYKDIKVYS